MNKKNYFAKEQAKANDMFFAADGFADDNFYGSEYSNANGFADDNFYGNSYSADGGCAPAVSVSRSNPYTFNIANSAAVDISNVVLLGANQNTVLNTTNFGNTGTAAAITITQQNGAVTYAQFLQAIKTQPFLIGEMQLQSSNTSQPFQTFTVSQTENDGRTSSVPYYPVLNPFQQQSGVAIIKQLIPVNSYTQFTFTILASATLTVRLYPAEQVDISRSVVGEPVSKPYNNPQIATQPFTLTGGKGVGYVI